MFCAWDSSSMSTSLKSLHKYFSSCGHSGFGHTGVCGSGFCSQGCKHFRVTWISNNVAEFVPIILEKGQPWCKSCSFFCVTHDIRNWCDNCGHTRATVVVQPPPGALSVSFVVLSTCIVFPSAETNSIMLVMSGWITSLCFFAKFSSMQSTEAPVWGKALRVASFSSWFSLLSCVSCLHCDCQSI